MKSAQELCPEIAELEVFDRLGEFPLFNQDLEGDPPAVIKEFKAKIKAADAILFVTPEYNYSIPGFLKNAIDWASRPYTDSSFNDKPGAIMSASTGMLGGARAQYVLRQVCVQLNVHLLNRPEVFVADVAEKVQAGILSDTHTKEKIRELLDALCVWTMRLTKD